MEDEEHLAKIAKDAAEKEQAALAAAKRQEEERLAIKIRHEQSNMWMSFQERVNFVLKIVNAALAPTHIHLDWTAITKRNFPFNSKTPIGDGVIAARHPQKQFKETVAMSVDANGTVAVLLGIDGKTEPMRSLEEYDCAQLTMIAIRFAATLDL